MDLNNKRNISGNMIVEPPEDAVILSQTHTVGFKQSCVNPPALQYVTVEDFLTLTLAGATSAANVEVNIRIMQPNGIVIPLVFVALVVNDRVTRLNKFPLMEGYILSCTVSTLSGLNNNTYIYAVVGILRNPQTATAQYNVLCCGYVGNTFQISYPQGQLQRPTDGAGLAKPVQVANPAAGADWTYTVPASSRNRIVSLSATLTAAAAVANRFVSLIIDDGANVVAVIPSGITLVATIVNTYTFADSVPQTAAFDLKSAAPLPSNIILPPAYRVRVTTTNIQAADQWTNIWLHIHDWIND